MARARHGAMDTTSSSGVSRNGASATGPVVHDGAIHNQSPVDLRPLAPIPVTPTEDVAKTILKARAAQRGWATRSFDDRVAVLKRAAKSVLERRHEVIALMREEVGKLEVDALMSEVLGPLDQVSSWASVIGPAIARKKVSLNPLHFPKKSAHVDRVARGVVGIIAPWNYPVATLFKTLIPALMTGNGVVLKPSEHATRVGIWFAERFADELPPGLVGVVVGDRTTGIALVEGGVDSVIFTGSIPTGRDVARRCGERLIPCSVELGGNDAAIVLDDCDLDRTVQGLTHWALHNVGQACGAVEIAYVDARIADQLVTRLKSAWQKLKVGDGGPGEVDLSPVSNARQLALVEAHVEDARKRGATIVTGGRRLTTRDGKPLGLFYEPTLIDHASGEMDVVKDETFGPVLAVVRVDGAAEAIRRVNAGRYGLTASIWSRDHARALRLSEQLEVGVVTINNHSVTGAMTALPWSGLRETGTGVANSEHALSVFVRPRTVLLDRNSDPELYWMPYDKALWELGNLIADAQLFKLGGAWKIPFLIKRRIDTVRAFFAG